MADHKESKGKGTAFRQLLVGPPRRALGRDSEASRITPVEGLSALSLDALTSVAYGPESIILVLAVAGAGALHLVLPITVAIVLLLAILVFSYRQVIDAYPGGGGAYAVSRANLGAHTSLVAAASLVVDYTLTVAVSIAAGVAGLASAFPSLAGATVPLCLGILLVITVLNLRGLGETARAFLLPTLVFIVGLLAIIAVGLIHPLGLNEKQLGTSQLPTSGLKAVSCLSHPARLLGRVQRAHRRRGDRQRGAAVPRATGRTGQADRDAARCPPRHHAPRPGGAREALAHRPPIGADRPQPDHGHGRRP